MILITGRIFGNIYRKSRNYRLDLYLLPIILVMCIISPIYYFFHVASIDFIIVTLLIEYALIKKFN